MCDLFIRSFQGCFPTDLGYIFMARTVAAHILGTELHEHNTHHHHPHHSNGTTNGTMVDTSKIGVNTTSRVEYHNRHNQHKANHSRALNHAQ